MKKEKSVIKAMLEMYCHNHHSSSGNFCLDCANLLEYALMRLDKCPFAEKKPTCSRCTIHCYSAPMRQRIIAVMKYSGPRMISKHPILAVSHMIREKIRR